jgi:hypothetical protein
MKNIFVMDNFLYVMVVLNMFAHASTLWAYNHVPTFQELNVLVAGTLNNVYVFLFSTVLSWVLIVAAYNLFKDSSFHTYYHFLRLVLVVMLTLDFFNYLLSTIGAMIR